MWTAGSASTNCGLEESAGAASDVEPLRTVVVEDRVAPIFAGFAPVGLVDIGVGTVVPETTTGVELGVELGVDIGVDGFGVVGAAFARVVGTLPVFVPPVGATLWARTESGPNLGTPEPVVPPMSVPPKTHRSTSPGFGAWLIAPPEL